MCGIIGLTAPVCGGRERSAVIAGIDTLTKRGPDAEGILSLPHSILGHRRLSIIDISGGAQPMQDRSKNFTITFNGEIYNYRELRKTLESKGCAFNTQSDTEVILEAYRVYGPSCVEYLDGMFAFAIWDERAQELFLARDRFGEKPLFYTHRGTELIFASEIKAILATGLMGARLDHISLDNYLALGYIPPWRSMYKDIHPLLPAHYAVFKNGTLTTTRYWQLRHNPINPSLDEAADTVRTLLGQSVKNRLVADVEVGAFLSGGIDSGIVTSLAQQTRTGRPLKSFTAGFEDFINELPYAEEIARAVGTDHYATHIHTDIAKAFQEAAAYLDEPTADSSIIPTQLLSSFARKHVPVALSGDGGDELFYGYGHHRNWFHRPLWRKVRDIFQDPFTNHPLHLPNYFSLEERHELLKQNSYVEHDIAKYLDLSEGATPLQKMHLIDLNLILPGDILTKVDRASMMHSLEVRAPFLQHDLVQYAFNLPDSYKTNRERGKLILEHAFKDTLPPGFFTRKKQGFGAPISAWLKKPELRPLVESLATPQAHLSSLLKTDRIAPIVASYIAGNDQLARRVWTLLALEMWLQTHPDIPTA